LTKTVKKKGETYNIDIWKANWCLDAYPTSMNFREWIT